MAGRHGTMAAAGGLGLGNDHDWRPLSWEATPDALHPGLGRRFSAGVGGHLVTNR